jgi:dihydrolipoamide dehydrogenase
MVVGNVPEAVDLLIAGGGPGGYTAALQAAHQGRSVVLVEANGAAGVGGVCLHTGCIPSKALIEAADLQHRAAHASSMGVTAIVQAFDMARFQSWKNSVVSGLVRGVQGLLQSAGVRVVTGTLRLVDNCNAVVANGDAAAQFFEFKSLVLATGSTPARLSVLPVDHVRIVDSTSALALARVPATVAVVGAGYIGLELGTALAKAGARVTLVEGMERVLPAMDESIARPVMRRLRGLGVEVRLNCEVQGVDDTALLVSDANGPAQIAAEVIVVAVGREPNTTALGLQDIGIAMDARGLLKPAPDRRLTPRIAAIGDITPGPALAHKASAEACVAVAALNGESVAFEPQTIPAVVFSDPEIAVTGVSASAARAHGLDVNVTSVPLTASGRAATLGADIGMATCVTDRCDGALLGVQLVGPHASELIGEATLAIELGASLEDIALTIHPHPTLSEQMVELAHLGIGVPVHAPKPRVP